MQAMNETMGAFTRAMLHNQEKGTLYQEALTNVTQAFHDTRAAVVDLKSAIENQQATMDLKASIDSLKEVFELHSTALSMLNLGKQ